MGAFLNSSQSHGGKVARPYRVAGNKGTGLGLPRTQALGVGTTAAPATRLICSVGFGGVHGRLVCACWVQCSAWQARLQ